MKKTFVLAALFLSVSLFAQEHRNEHKEKRSSHKKMEMLTNFSPEQMAELKSKKLTLALDLSEQQQKEIYSLTLNNIKDRKKRMENHKDSDSKKERSSENRYEMMNKKLDKQIEMKKKMKAILTADQFEKFSKMSQRKNRQKHS